MTLYQAGQAGQPGWNDCLLLNAKTAKQPRSASSSRTVSATIPPPPASSVSAKPEPADATSAAVRDGSDSEEDEKATVDMDQILSQLDEIFKMETTLPPREANHYKTKLQKVLPTVDSCHYGVIYNALKDQQKEELVNHSLVHNGVSAWVLPLRKVIESVKH